MSTREPAGAPRRVPRLLAAGAAAFAAVALPATGRVAAAAADPSRDGGVAAQRFEVPPAQAAAASLPPAEVSGADFHVQEPVVSDGLMHHYVVVSRFGNFPAYGRDALAVRLREVAALATIERTSQAQVVFKSVARGIREDAATALQVARHPVDTVLGVPRGISHLLGGYRAQAEEAVHQAGQVLHPGSAGAAAGSAPADGAGAPAPGNAVSDGGPPGSGSSPGTIGAAASKAGHLARDYAQRYLGLTAAERRWYEQLQVDPYTDNEVLRRAVERLARIDAAASFGMKFAPVGIPFAGEIRHAVDAIYHEDPAVLRKRRHDALAACGLTPAEVRRFESTLLLNPTRQTLLVDAVQSLDGVEGRAELLRHAMSVTGPEEIQVFLHSMSLMMQLHARQSIARVLPGVRLPAVQLPGGRVLVFGAFDAVYWTTEVAGYERELRAALPAPGAASQPRTASSTDDTAPERPAALPAEGTGHELHAAAPADAPARELWLTGSASPRAREALARLGWAVHEHSGQQPADTK